MRLSKEVRVTDINKNSSFLHSRISYGCNKFYGTGPCPYTRLAQKLTDKHASLFVRSVSNGEKSFVKLAPGRRYESLRLDQRRES